MEDEGEEGKGKARRRHGLKTWGRREREVVYSIDIYPTPRNVGPDSLSLPLFLSLSFSPSPTHPERLSRLATNT